MNPSKRPNTELCHFCYFESCYICSYVSHTPLKNCENANVIFFPVEGRVYWQVDKWISDPVRSLLHRSSCFSPFFLFLFSPVKNVHWCLWYQWNGMSFRTQCMHFLMCVLFDTRMYRQYVDKQILLSRVLFLYSNKISKMCIHGTKLRSLMRGGEGYDGAYERKIIIQNEKKREREKQIGEEWMKLKRTFKINIKRMF